MYIYRKAQSLHSPHVTRSLEAIKIEQVIDDIKDIEIFKNSKAPVKQKHIFVTEVRKKLEENEVIFIKSNNKSITCHYIFSSLELPDLRMRHVFLSDDHGMINQVGNIHIAGIGNGDKRNEKLIHQLTQTISEINSNTRKSA